ncbi:Guanylate-binding protein 6 [Camelus dromedarius]|uniref:Guanylate-binding protein 6 n=1 Tax=Camelus dromedarius TaxID=9838 RepID=A0A5N4BXA8_CAMDR|nr:Guanylate-binding protein 6 [Camelus dromedarius]
MDPVCLLESVNEVLSVNQKALQILGQIMDESKKDSWIFALAVVLCSSFVYNSMSTINHQALEQLQVEDSTEFVNFFPEFIWTVWDFTLELKLHGQPITEDKYLENALKLIPVTTLAQLENSAAIQKADNHYSEQIAQRSELPHRHAAGAAEAHAACEREAPAVFMEHSFKEDKQEFQRNLGNLRGTWKETAEKEQELLNRNCRSTAAGGGSEEKSPEHIVQMMEKWSKKICVLKD